MTCIPIQQTPDEYNNYSIKWAARGLDVGESIVDSVFTTDSVDYTLSNENINGLLTTFFLTGGIVGTQYYITNTITTSEGRILQETLQFSCVSANQISGCNC